MAASHGARGRGGEAPTVPTARVPAKARRPRARRRRPGRILGARARVRPRPQPRRAGASAAALLHAAARRGRVPWRSWLRRVAPGAAMTWRHWPRRRSGHSARRGAVTWPWRGRQGTWCPSPCQALDLGVAPATRRGRSGYGGSAAPARAQSLGGARLPGRARARQDGRPPTAHCCPGGAGEPPGARGAASTAHAGARHAGAQGAAAQRGPDCPSTAQPPRGGRLPTSTARARVRLLGHGGTSARPPERASAQSRGSGSAGANQAQPVWVRPRRAHGTGHGAPLRRVRAHGILTEATRRSNGSSWYRTLHA